MVDERDFLIELFNIRKHNMNISGFLQEVIQYKKYQNRKQQREVLVEIDIQLDKIKSVISSLRKDLNPT